MPKFTDYDVNAPPKSIWDPPKNTSSSVSFEESSNDRSRRKSSLDHPHRVVEDEDRSTVSWSDKAMRIQLWDTFRLARIILEEPIKSQRLSSHLILHAICKVAEMKLQLSKIQNGMNDSSVAAKTASNIQAMTTTTTSSTKTIITTNTMASSSPIPTTNTQITSGEEMVTSETSIPSTTLQQQYEMAQRILRYEVDNSFVVDDDDEAETEEHDDDVYCLQEAFSEDDEILAQNQKSSKLQGSPFTMTSSTSHYSWGTSDDSDDLSPPPRQRSKEMDNKDDDTVKVFRREVLSPPDLGTTRQPRVDGETTATTLTTLSSTQPKADDYAALLRQQSEDHYDEIESMLRNLNVKVHETSLLTSSAIQSLHSKLADAQAYHAEALRQQDQRTQNSSPSSSMEARNARLTMQQQSKKHQQELDVILSQLHDKVREASEHTTLQIEALHQTLRNAKMQQETVHARVLADLKQQIQDQKEEAQKKQLDAIVLQYLQTQEELQRQLEQAQNNLQAQEQDLEVWKRKYQQLESTTISPSEAQDVLNRFLQWESHVQPFKDGACEQPTLRCSEVSSIFVDVIHLLSRAAKQQTREEHEQDVLTEKLKQAKKQYTESIEELEFLRLQKELLIEDTTKVNIEQYQQMSAVSRDQYQNELAAVLEAHNNRRQEIDSLEDELTHLAFLAVEIEDCERDFLEQQQFYQQSLEELKAQNLASAEKLQNLKSDVDQKIHQEASKVLMEGEKQNGRLGTADLRIRKLELALSRRDAELDDVKSQLKTSEERVRLLESAVTSQ